MQSFLQEKFGKKVHILVPQKGVKKSLVEASKRNAEEYSLHSLDRMERDKRLTTDALKELAELLNVDKVYRIEGYDISNISGTNNVASMVVFEGGVPCKKEYRKFKIKTVNGANDFVGSYMYVFFHFYRQYQLGFYAFRHIFYLLAIDNNHKA